MNDLFGDAVDLCQLLAFLLSCNHGSRKVLMRATMRAMTASMMVVMSNMIFSSFYCLSGNSFTASMSESRSRFRGDHCDRPRASD
jgi:hypothetical protein